MARRVGPSRPFEALYFVCGDAASPSWSNGVLSEGALGVVDASTGLSSVAEDGAVTGREVDEVSLAVDN